MYLSQNLSSLSWVCTRVPEGQPAEEEKAAAWVRVERRIYTVLARASKIAKVNLFLFYILASPFLFIF